ncbi:MAG: aminotransferase class V-fold PLP-dependent enzyme [Clostridiales bacterium]|nr:aminotransferase class V-fold PLP-dependent enzyme [Clostridiales bacterium]
MNIYFDNAATSHPKPPSVIRAVNAALTDFNANPGRSGHAAALEAARHVLAAREVLARILGAEDPFCITHTFNCTDALNLAIKGVLRKGDHVVCTQLEHNSVLRVLGELEHRKRIYLTIVPPRPDGFIDPEDIRRALTPATRLIVCTHASNVTGAIQPVAAIGTIAREYGITYLIDGAQALGCLPVNVAALKCDLYAFPGHKSLLGPQGTGGLYIRKGLVLSTLREGGTGSSSDNMLQPSELPERYESGTVNLPGIAGLLAGAEYVHPRLDQIMIHERELTSALMEALSPIPGIEIYSPREESARAGIVTFNLPGMTSSQTADALAAQGIAVRGGLHCAPGAHRFLGTASRGAVRASVGHASTFEEVESFAKAVRNLGKAL